MCENEFLLLEILMCDVAYVRRLSISGDSLIVPIKRKCRKEREWKKVERKSFLHFFGLLPDSMNDKYWKRPFVFTQTRNKEWKCVPLSTYLFKIAFNTFLVLSTSFVGIVFFSITFRSGMWTQRISRAKKKALLTYINRFIIKLFRYRPKEYLRFLHTLKLLLKILIY